MDIRTQIDNASEKDVRETLDLILLTYLSPAFGSITKRETDILMFNVLEKIGYIDDNPTLYSLIKKLRITRSKARSLLYERELRRLGEIELDKMVLQALKHPLIQKQGELFVLEIENPLLIDYLRSKVQQLGYASDGSFSPSLVKLSDDAIVAILDNLLDERTKVGFRKELVKAGFPDKSFKGILKDVLRAIGKKLADEAGKEIAESVLGPIIDGTFDKVAEVIAENGITTIIARTKKEDNGD